MTTLKQLGIAAMMAVVLWPLTAILTGISVLMSMLVTTLLIAPFVREEAKKW